MTYFWQQFQPMTAMNESAIKQRIRNLREKNGLSQKAMADRLDINRNTYLRIETGCTRIVCKDLETIAEILGSTEEYLLFGHDPVDPVLLHDAVREKDRFDEMRQTLVDEYEKRIALLQNEVRMLNDLVSSKDEHLRTLLQIKSRYEKLLDEND